jgi:two-component system sensor histidine kinase KdpD
MNLQHLESLNDQILQITGVRVRETVPDWVIGQANEVVLVDVTPEALINRIKRGVVYEPEKAERALQNFFKEATLGGLRELALRQAAHEVELRQESTQDPPVEDRTGSLQTRAEAAKSRVHDRILIHVTADPSSAMLIRRGRRVADFLRADCFAVYVGSNGQLDHLAPAEREATERHLNFARSLHIEARIIEGDDIAAALVEFAYRQHITQIFMSRSVMEEKKRFQRNLLFQVLRLAPDIQITIVARRSKAAAILST